jgi:hypothetical protein
LAITYERIQQIKGAESLFAFLREELDWPVSDVPETFPFFAEELSLDDETAGRVGSVSQIANFERGQPWGVFLIKFNGDRIYKSALRRVLRGLSETRQNRDASLPAWTAPNLLFICTPDYQDFAFARFEGDSHTRATLSIFGWEQGEAGLRTLCEYNLPALRYPSDPTDTERWRKQWATAWDVEAATQRFYTAYEDVFRQVEGMVTGVQGDRRLFTQRLFNRLMFVHFLSKKGWLRFDGSKSYLPALYAAAVANGENFFHDRLYWLFFYGLGTLNDNREAHHLDELRHKRGDVPYLNGGLFEMVDADDVQGAVQIENRAFELILTRLIARFNFTIHESTPLDIEVAVDPEMLGKVFEELVTGRHETGSYYTPRQIVAFMCREALKGYLGGYEKLVDEHDAGGVTVPEARELLKKLAAVKVVDPACGSGAYLLGMLQQLHALTLLLDTRAEQATARDNYQRKLAIIRNNLYGVDKDEFAVNIARLRLWLALAVEYEGDRPEPLPNLDFKIECGDSLTAPNPTANAAQMDARSDLIRAFTKAKADYADPYYPGSKPDLKKQIAELREDIAGWTHPGQTVLGFDWQVEFAEVFEPQEPIATIGGAFNFGQELAELPTPGGFDIVTANPPYVRQELLGKEYKEQRLKPVYPEVYAGTADLYVYFYARALQLLRPSGMLAFISSNKWFRAGYGANLRRHIAETCRVSSITDFGDLPVFRAATAYPMIFVAQKGYSVATPLFAVVRSLEPPYPDVLALIRRDGIQLSSEALRGKDWTLTDTVTADRLRKMEKAGVRLGEYIGKQVYRGVLTGLNEAFYIDGAKREELIRQDARSAELIQPLVMGRDIKKWAVDYQDRWHIVTPIGVAIECYSAILAHLSQWQEALEKRWDKGKHWWELRACDYYDVFGKPKIVYQEIATFQSFALETRGAIMNNKVFLLPVHDLFLLGVLNSQPAWDYLNQTCSKLQGGAFAMQTPYVMGLPIPTASDTDRTRIAALVQKCLDAKGVGCAAWEAEINARVAALYGL